MAKQMPTKKSRGIPAPRYDSYNEDYYCAETNTDYLNKHAEEWDAPLGEDLHLHLIYAKHVHWRVVGQSSAVCKIAGRCHKVDIKRHES
jgi:hypothetical protein